MIYYTVYKTSNKLNGKIYIGSHKTRKLDDGYLGSGVLLKKAIEKYGVENFDKEILFVFETSEEMFRKEAEIVTKEFLSENNTYNLKVGGEGGFDHLNSNSDIQRQKAVKANSSPKRQTQEYKDRLKKIGSQNFKKAWEEGKLTTKSFAGKKHSEETKRIIAEKASARMLLNNPMKGRKRTEEEKHKISATLKARSKKE